MIDVYLMNDLKGDVKRICKQKYKKNFFDFSGRWKEEFKKVWPQTYRNLCLWIEEIDPERYTSHCQACGKDYIYIACPDFCVKCHEQRERNGKHIEYYANTK